MSADRPWTSFYASRPTERGLYEWRVPHIKLEGLFVTFEAEMRTRGAGFETVLSPSFDQWDGWNVLVPEAFEWRPRPEGAETPKHRQSYTCIEVEGVEHDPCPFCKGKPRWKVTLDYLYGGTDYGPKPYQANRWSLQCCTWAANTPSRPDPRLLAEERNFLLRTHAGSL